MSIKTCFHFWESFWLKHIIRLCLITVYKALSETFSILWGIFYFFFLNGGSGGPFFFFFFSQSSQNPYLWSNFDFPTLNIQCKEVKKTCPSTLLQWNALPGAAMEMHILVHVIWAAIDMCYLRSQPIFPIIFYFILERSIGMHSAAFR